MKKEIFWNEEKKQYVIDNYVKLSNELIAANIGTTAKKVICKAYHLRNKGAPVRSYPIVKWKNPEIKEALWGSYGSIPTHKLATRYKTTIGAIHRTASRLGIVFSGSTGGYTTTELAKLLKIDEQTLIRWTKMGLKISAYVKDGLTKPRKAMISNTQPRPYCGLIDPDDLKIFFKKRPEAYNLKRLTDETKFIIGLDRIKDEWKQKKVFCKKCQLDFWTEIHNDQLRCPECKRIVSKWAQDLK